VAPLSRADRRKVRLVTAAVVIVAVVLSALVVATSHAQPPAPTHSSSAHAGP
jgi:hypothetical protein